MCNQHYNQDIEQLFTNNLAWVDKINRKTPEFFSNLSNQQTPEYLWIGCSDSRVPANELVKMDPGTIFVHRNIANLVNSSDMNVLSVIQYAVEVLKVKHIIINGHYGCGGVQAAMNESNPDLIDHWIRPIRKYYQRSKNELNKLSMTDRIDQLCEINVIEQVRNICHIPAIRKAWKSGQALAIHGFIYDIKDGRLHNLNITVDNIDEADKIVSRNNDI
ncbi:Carbonic anhydrase [Bathymodiolus thermophilus thioautotrophic gill symbiont]|jgi:carbonic anhydrase|uniref:Carbonic anhydrase n=1 Tax=Bathymodiolus thermophilus thioautotrophic gill symbiont TaxID=2360 RepID=A0A1J5TVA9_9GAMM|nr:carbonic anhydrase [Bathymodiolus thermophilus thioautotrophic gill symbiont]OIR24763.1 carbonic anhydrase [Bathymodiolus thermophilus thioautotrophic gill symbiont]CAB5494027.1 Carbonic anhydrase, beta class (EC [Bathymodiolus thermophilus thioautotrophic gill symbiont]SHA03368.1 Carbonic anhydrase [Bathymodiolus thermophilus thioautotrophic gill symbiont]